MNDLYNSLKEIADRWDETEVWHDPPFLNGKIEISTGDLRDLSEFLKRHNKLVNALQDIKKHFEFIAPDLYSKSAVWQIANKALEEVASQKPSAASSN